MSLNEQSFLPTNLREGSQKSFFCLLDPDSGREGRKWLSPVSELHLRLSNSTSFLSRFIKNGEEGGGGTPPESGLALGHETRLIAKVITY